MTLSANSTLIRACRDASVRYALERKTFGHRTAEYQLVKEMTATIVSHIASRTGMAEAEAQEALKKMNPQNRLINPEEVTAEAALLACDSAHGINGEWRSPGERQS
ncbi:MAG: acyl-CoA/acyl-ACP dehydrogenase [Acidobacteria bacterium]|nr:acyl-CoA/acyl-ACP dehydrogenase [Acidobacteriota bacterium]